MVKNQYLNCMRDEDIREQGGISSGYVFVSCSSPVVKFNSYIIKRH